MPDCPVCNTGTLQEQLVETWMPIDASWVLFKNVPAHVCDTCGEKTFDQPTAERLTSLLRDDRRTWATSFDYSPTCDLERLRERQARGETPLAVTGTALGTGPVSGPSSETPRTAEIGITAEPVNVFP
jgi:YgiT-type zinc finger domain-containing protein